MDIRLIATLPRFSIEDHELTLPEARLVKISFDEILQFEVQQQSADYDKQRSGYTRNPPVFFEKWIEVPDDYFDLELIPLLREMRKIAEPHISTCVCAIHFFSGVPILSPFLSTIYFDYRNDSNFRKNPNLENQFTEIGAYRIYGDSDKEYVLLNQSPTIHISKFENESFKQFYQFINSKSRIIQHNELQSLIEPCKVLALPGINLSIHLILLTNALESFLIPDISKQIGEQFRKRFSNLCHLNGDKDRAWLDKVYKFRSELIHGNSIERLLVKIPFSFHEFIINLHRYIIVGFCKFLQYAKVNDEIEVQLKLFRDTLALDEKDKRLTELLDSSDYSKTNNSFHQWDLNINQYGSGKHKNQ